MPGSKGNRTKGNVKPSSSSRAAELLSQSGATGFVGFGGVGGVQAYVPASQAFDDVDSCLDSDFRLVLRKLTKRDATTKIKTLGEFSSLCKEKEDSTLQAVLPFWPRLYNKLAIDVDPKVREHTQNAMATLVRRVRRNLAPYLKNVMGAWILSRNDTYPTVSSAANKSFNAAFPPEKQESAIVFCKQAVVEYLIDNLLNQTPLTLSDPKTTEKEEMEAKYQRVLASSLMGLRQLLQALPSAQVDDALKGHLRGLLNDAKFWNLSKSQVPSVRGGLFWFLGSLCQAMPDVAGEYVRKISPLVLGSVDVLEPGLIAAVWDALLSCVKFIPSCWDNVNWQKAFWPKLKKVVESGCQGNAVSVAPNFLPLFSCLPMDTAGGAEVFFPKVLELFKEGFAKDCVVNSPSETNAWAKAFMECLQFSFRQIGGSEESSQGVLKAILLDQLVPVVEASLFDPKPALSRSILYPSVSSFLQTVATNEDTAALASVFWSQLSADLAEMFEAVGSGEKQALRPDRVVMFIRALLSPQDASQFGGGKSERVRFAAEESEHQQPCSVGVEVSEDVRSVVKKVVVHSHRLYRKDGQSVHLKLFVDLANLYFPEDMATFVLHSLESEENAAGSGEGTAQGRERSMDERENLADAHSKVIDRVVLPVLGGREKSDEEVVGHTITLLFACLPYLSEKSSTDVWDSVLQTVSSTAALCSLVERALEKRRIMPQVSGWLSSTRLHARLCDLVAMVTSQHSSLPPEEVEQGWKIVCLVLSANDDSEPVFPTSWIVDIVSSIRQELMTLASGPLGQKEIQLAIQFVAKAALTFFLNLKMSLCLDEGRDVIVALLMADLDSGLTISGEASSVLRESWTTGLGLAVQETGGLLQEGSILSSACRILRDALLTHTHTMQQYRQVIEVTDELLKTTVNHLPKGDNTNDSNNAHNPSVFALLSELLVPVSQSVADSNKVVQYHCLTGRIPLTFLDHQPTEGADCSHSMATVVFSSLFNLHLLRCAKNGFRFDTGGEDEEPCDTRDPPEWEGREEGVMLDVVKSLCLATAWCEVESKVSGDMTSCVEDLITTTHACFSSLSKTAQQRLIRRAFASIKDHPQNSLTFTYLADLWSKQQGAMDKLYFQELCNSFREEPDNALQLETVMPFLPQWLIGDLFQIQAAMLTSLADNPDALTPLVCCLRVMTAALSAESTFISSTYQEMVQDVLTVLKTMRDDESSMFLFSCDVAEEPVCRVAFNVAAVQFLTAVVSSGVFRLTSDLWDFILCSLVSWVESVDSSHTSLGSSVSVQAYCAQACRLVAAIALTIQNPAAQNEDIYPPNLKTEWAEFFAEGIYSFLFPLFIKLVGQLKDTQAKGPSAVILRAVGSAMSLCPQEQITGHHLPLNLSASDDTSPIPESLQTVLNHLCPALTCDSPPAQVAAFGILDKIVTLLPSYKKEEAGASADASASAGASAAETPSAELESRAPPTALMKTIDDCAAAMDVVLTPVPMETTIAIVPGTEEYQFALGYLLAWQLLLHLFHSADSTGRAEYAAYLKEHSSVRHLLHHLFRLMPHTPSLCSLPGEGGSLTPSARGGAEKSTTKSSCRLLSDENGEDSWFTSSDLPLTPVDVGQLADVQLASCRVYLHCLEVIPVLVRQWWKDQDRRTAAYVDKFTSKYVSQQLIRSEMQAVNSSDSAIKDLVVKANSITRQVTATYTAEELKAEIQITLPENYPLGEISVDAQRHAVVKLAQWDRLLLQVNVFLQHQNGPIMEGLRLWKRNIDKKLEGVEECFICYAVIHATNLDLPRIPCGTCKKKFHSACLYKWLNSSQNATCPLCRSVFF